MTAGSGIKISQLTDIGEDLAVEDRFILRDFSDATTPNKAVTVSGLTNYLKANIAPLSADITLDTTPFIWQQSSDTYFEYVNNFQTETADNPTTAGLTYVTQPDLRVHSSIRRVGLNASGYVNYCLDGENSNLYAGDWVKIYEGEAKAGNTGSNTYVRKYLESWQPGTYTFRDRVIYNDGVWECVAASTTATPASGTAEATNAIKIAASGNVMVEVPEFYVRADFHDGTSWKNAAGADVSSEYKQLPVTGNSATDPLRVLYVLPKDAYTTLASGEQQKFIRHPAFWTNYDASADRTIYINGVSATVLDGNPYISERDDSGYTRVFDGTQYNYWTISGTAAASGDFDTSTAIRYRYLPAYQGTTDGTRLQSLSGSGVYVSHTRATGRARARAIASGWSNGTYAVWNAAQVLTLTEYRNFYIQDPTVGIGRGRDNFNSLAGYRDYPLGILNTQGNKTANNTTNGQDSTAGSDRLAAMQWRGIEHYYAATWRWWDGFNVNSGNVYLSLNPDLFADDTTTNYTSVGSIATNLSSTYIGGFTDDIGLFFLPEAGGTASTYVTDAAWSSTGWRVLVCGGVSDAGALCGPWFFVANLTSSNASTPVGSALVR